MTGQPLLEEDVDAGFCLLIQQGQKEPSLPGCTSGLCQAQPVLRRQVEPSELMNELVYSHPG